MSNHMVSLTQHEQGDENKLIHFTPAETCAHCPRLTTVSILDEAMPQWFAPICPLHGLCSSYSLQPTSRELADQRFSIERFVLWMHGECGRVVLVSMVEPDAVPGYTVNLDPFAFEPLAWHCRYESPDGERKDVSVVWEIGISQFSLFRDGQPVSERREEVTA